MVKAYVETLSAFFVDTMSYLPPGLILSVAAAFIQEGKYLETFQQEFVGTMLMIAFTFSAGKWIGEDSPDVAWLAHAMGVIAADFIGGGPHVNPAVTTSMWCLGKVTYTDAFVRVAAQMGGGLISFPLFHAFSNAFNLTPFGGPEFTIEGEEHPVEAFLSEFFSTMLLCFVIYLVNWELHFGPHHYIIKQSLTALAIRALIEFFPTAGPAMNPMLATCWAVFGVGTTYEYPSELEHYFVYWLSPCLAAILASFLYVVYAGGTVFGFAVPFGPIKEPEPQAPAHPQPTAPAEPVKPETKPTTKPETKPTTKPDTKPTTKPETKPNPTKDSKKDAKKDS